MLDRSKLFGEMSKIKLNVLGDLQNSYHQLGQGFQLLVGDEDIVTKLRLKKWPLLVPFWQGSIEQTIKIQPQQHPYSVLGVDGSQIYYDKHQGPACYLINIGSILLSYGQYQSTVQMQAAPELILAGQNYDLDVQSVSLHRDHAEMQTSLDLSKAYRTQYPDTEFLCMHDGSLIFMHHQIDGQDENFKNYIAQLMNFERKKIVHVAYVSFPRTKDLLNVVRLAVAKYDVALLPETESWAGLTDMDVVKLFLPKNHRTTMFESKVPLSYAYPESVKPYFCYVNVDHEIIRLEFPAWIARDRELVDTVCGIVLDQTIKGAGYPVVLFEAHQQAVVSGVDREFFYQTIKNTYQAQGYDYDYSVKSLKKRKMPI